MATEPRAIRYEDIAPPYRLKVVEPIRLLPEEARATRLVDAGYNVLNLRGSDVFIDLFTDSGMSAMSADQWSAAIRGDETYARSESFYVLEEAVRDLFGYRYLIPCHQGRAAQNLLYEAVIPAGTVAMANTFYGGYLIQKKGAETLNVNVQSAHDLTSDDKFKGDIDIDRLRTEIRRIGRDQVSAIVPVLTNNLGCGHPMSLDNLRQVWEVAQAEGIPLYLDACRIMENAYFIKEGEEGQQDRSIRDIVRTLCSYSDGCIFSGKKDGLCNIGGFLATNDEAVYDRILPRVFAIGGFLTSGGMAGRDMMALARGLVEAQDERHLRHRIGQVRWLAQGLSDAGIPVIRPYSGSAVYIDSAAFMDHLDAEDFRAECIAAAAYLEGGVRVGAFGQLRGGSKSSNAAGDIETVRICLPRRMYDTSHLEVCRLVFKEVYQQRHRIRGLQILSSPQEQRFYTAKLSPKYEKFRQEG